MKKPLRVLSSALLLAGTAVAAAPRSGFTAQTLEQCLTAAAVAANNCYMSYDSEFMKKICDITWSIAIERCALKAVTS